MTICCLLLLSLAVIISSRYKLLSESEIMYDFEIPRTRFVRSGPRSFSVSGPTLWKSAVHCYRVPFIETKNMPINSQPAFM